MIVPAGAISPHRLLIVTGHFGTGKTEFSVNLALALARAGEKVMLADLDIVNPYFRSRERRADFRYVLHPHSHPRNALHSGNSTLPCRAVRPHSSRPRTCHRSYSRKYPFRDVLRFSIRPHILSRLPRSSLRYRSSGHWSIRHRIWLLPSRYRLPFRCACHGATFPHSSRRCNNTWYLPLPVVRHTTYPHNGCCS